MHNIFTYWQGPRVCFIMPCVFFSLVESASWEACLLVIHTWLPPKITPYYPCKMDGRSPLLKIGFFKSLYIYLCIKYVVYQYYTKKPSVYKIRNNIKNQFILEGACQLKTEASTPSVE